MPKSQNSGNLNWNVYAFLRCYENKNECLYHDSKDITRIYKKLDH